MYALITNFFNREFLITSIFFILFFVSIKDFLFIPKRNEEEKIYFPTVILFFSVYFVMIWLVTPLVFFIASFLFKKTYEREIISYLIFSLFLSSVFIYFFKSLKFSIKSMLFGKEKSLFKVLLRSIAISLWGLSLCYPIFLCLGKIEIYFTKVIMEFFKNINLILPYNEQEIITQFRLASDQIVWSSLFLFVVLIPIPFVEEFLFRRVLQKFLMNYMKRYKAIALASLLFSCCHFSMKQGLANIVILSYLFVFSFFLGVVFEKENKLITPIFLHSLFNLYNSLKLF